MRKHMKTWGKMRSWQARIPRGRNNAGVFKEQKEKPCGRRGEDQVLGKDWNVILQVVMGSMFGFPQNSYIETLAPNLMVFRGAL